MASSSYDPKWVSKTIRDCWNFLSAQLGHWNKSKIIAMDCMMYEKLPAPVLDGLAREATNFQNTECMWLRDGANLSVYILGSKELLEKHIATTSTGLTVWDPLHKHVVLPDKRGKSGRARTENQPRRPPNAFILYRKDKHPEIKKTYPEIHNNEISVLAGSMWKNESEEVRQKYHVRALTIKKALLKEVPDYKYSPRKSDEIHRRKRQLPLVRAGQRDATIIEEHEEVIRQLFPGAIGVISDHQANSTLIYQEYGVSAPRRNNIANWTPQTVSAAYAAIGLPPPSGSSIDQAAVFGQVLPSIDFDAATAAPVQDMQDDLTNQEDLEMPEFFGDIMMNTESNTMLYS